MVFNGPIRGLLQELLHVHVAVTKPGTLPTTYNVKLDTTLGLQETATQQEAVPLDYYALVIAKESYLQSTLAQAA
jgi:hypothetical protein